MRTIITNDLENKVQTTEKISLTKRGVVSQISTTLLGDNEAAELKELYTNDKVSSESNEYDTLIRDNGDIIYREQNGIVRTVTHEGYLIYNFPTLPNIMDVNFDCDNKGLVNDKIILNYSYQLYVVGFEFFELTPYSADTMFQIFINTYFVGGIKYSDLVSGKYTDITKSAPEGANEETKEIYDKLHRLYQHINSYRFAQSQVSLKIYTSGNENDNARGIITMRFQTYEVDDNGNIITDSITKILNGGDATGE